MMKITNARSLNRGPTSPGKVSSQNQAKGGNKLNKRTVEDFDELIKLAKPLQDWMMKNYNMMCRIEITCDDVTVLSTEMSAPMIAEGL